MTKQLNTIGRMTLPLAIAAALGSCQHFEYPEMILIPDPPSSPLAYYLTFDHESTADSSIYAFPVQAEGITFVPGVSGTAMQGAPGQYVLIDTLATDFHGIDLREQLSEMTGFTISCWINLATEQATGGQALFSIADRTGTDWIGNLDILIDAPENGKLPIATHIRNHRGGVLKDFWVAKDNTPEIYLDNVLDKWTHLAIRYSGKSSTITYFRDGEKIFAKTSADFGELTFAHTGAVLLGAFQNITSPQVAEGAEVQGWEATFPGMVDQFRFYTQFLTDKQIKDLYNSKR